MKKVRTEEEVDAMIEDLIKRNPNSDFITQGVSFSKYCPRQLNELKQWLMFSKSFSGAVKHVGAIFFSGSIQQSSQQFPQNNTYTSQTNNSEMISIGNFG
jgi:hypothetical protein